MEEISVKEYRSGYTQVKYVIGFVTTSTFGDNPERYVLRVSNGIIMVYSIIETVNATGLDILRALNFQNPDGKIFLIVAPYAEFAGNAFKFFSSLNPHEPFLTVTTTEVLMDYCRGFAFDGFAYNAFFGLGEEFPNDANIKNCRFYDEFASLFYRRIVLQNENVCLVQLNEPAANTQSPA